MSVSTTVLDPKVIEFIKNSQLLGSKAIQGVGCTDIGESLPRYDPAGCEKVYEGKNNNYIVLGRDKPGGELSGCGGRGDSQCGMIDLVAGRISSTIMNQLRKNPSKPIDSNTVVDSNFFADAARVYITQRALNIDEYLGFKNEKGSDPTELSAAIIKSDCTRIVGRESVRIYAGGASGAGFGSGGEPRSNATDIDNPRIELIVGNQGEDDMQPAVMGENLKAYLQRNNEINSNLHQVLTSLMNQITMMQAAFAFIDGGAMIASGATQNIQNLNT
ncbi:MAG: hypothetical protein ACXADW_22895, partial [Candidatus Hodarchaeales archaeon]